MARNKISKRGSVKSPAPAATSGGPPAPATSAKGAPPRATTAGGKSPAPAATSGGPPAPATSAKGAPRTSDEHLPSDVSRIPDGTCVELGLDQVLPGSPPALPETLPSGLPRIGDGALVPLDIAALWASGKWRLQGGRFTEKFKVYDTEQRCGIRKQLWDGARLAFADPLAPRRGFVTGIGGNGKSHNLALFVAQARAAGAAVAYIHDMQTWLEDITLIIRELHFAAAQRGISLDKLPLLKDATAILSTAANPNAELYKEACESRDLLREKLKTTGKLADLIAELRICCTALGAPLIVLIDQDNRLNSLKGEDDDLYKTYNRMILTIAPHLLILSASANNEGWERRNWEGALRIEHYPEPVPSAVLRELFPKVCADAVMNQMLKDEFNTYPLMVGEAERMREKSPNVSVPKVQKQLAVSVEHRIRRFYYGPSTENYCGSLVQSVFEYMDRDVAPTVLFYDRNFMYVHRDATTDAETLRSVFPLAAEMEKKSLVVRFGASAMVEVNRHCPAAVKYEVFFGEVAARLFCPVGVEMTQATLHKAYLRETDFPKTFWTSKRDSLVFFRNCPRGQDFDFVSVRKWVRREAPEAPEVTEVTITFFQLTVNTSHSASDVTCATTARHFLKEKSILSECVDLLRRKLRLAKIHALFVYLTPHDGLELTGSTSQPLSWAADGTTWTAARLMDNVGTASAPPAGARRRDGGRGPQRGHRGPAVAAAVNPLSTVASDAFRLLFLNHPSLVRWVRVRPRDRAATCRLEAEGSAPPAATSAAAPSAAAPSAAAPSAAAPSPRARDGPPGAPEVAVAASFDDVLAIGVDLTALRTIAATA